MTKKIHRYNYSKSTYAVFEEVDFEPTKWHYQSNSGSAYFYTKEGVYRKSNHWGRAGKCRWVLEKRDKELYYSKIKNRTYTGYAKWTDFYINDEKKAIYFIKVNYEAKEVNYEHKSRDSKTNPYFNAKETQKKIKKIKPILLNDNWQKYYDSTDYESLRKELIEKIING